MIRTIFRTAAVTLAGAGLAASLSTAALAQDWLGPRVVGSGENASVVYAEPSANIVGGATYRTVGTGEGASLEVVGVEHAIPGRLSRTVGSGESAEIILIDPALRLVQGGTQG